MSTTPRTDALAIPGMNCGSVLALARQLETELNAKNTAGSPHVSDAGNDADSTEKIVAAAIRHGLVVFTGPHHHTIIRDIVGMGYAQRVGAGFDQGFLTSKGRYVDRPEATNIAIGAKQITVKKFDQTDLFSEELWEVRSHWEAPKAEGSREVVGNVPPKVTAETELREDLPTLSGHRGKTVEIDGEAIAANACMLSLFRNEYRNSGDRHSDALHVREYLVVLTQERHALHTKVTALEQQNKSLSDEILTNGLLEGEEADHCNALIEENGRLKKTNQSLNRRCQMAEGIVAKFKLVEQRPQGEANRSFGRALANYAAEKYRRERDEARTELAAEMRKWLSAIAELCGWKHLSDEGRDWWRSSERDIPNADKVEDIGLTPDDIFGALNAWNESRKENALLQAREQKLVETLKDLRATCRDSSWAHTINATADDPCRCKSCSIKKADAALLPQPTHKGKK